MPLIALAGLFAAVFLGMLVVFVIDAPVAILVHLQIVAVQIVVVMGILTAVSLALVILVLVTASFALTILWAMSVNCVNQDILGMPRIRTAVFVIVIALVQLTHSVTGMVANAHA